MLKKVLIPTTIAFSLLALNATATANGFYAGGELGITSLNTDITHKENVSLNGLGLIASSEQDNTTSAAGINASLLAGYGWDFSNQMYLGTEVFAGTTSAQIKTSNDVNIAGQSISGNETLNQRYTYGIRVLPGYHLAKDTVGYAILGLVRSNFKTQGNGDESQGIINPDQQFNLNGYQAGFGAQTNVIKNVAVRADVIYSGYSSKTFSITDTDGSITGNLSRRYAPYTIEGNVGVVYKFG